MSKLLGCASKSKEEAKVNLWRGGSRSCENARERKGKDLKANTGEELTGIKVLNE